LFFRKTKMIMACRE